MVMRKAQTALPAEDIRRAAPVLCRSAGFLGDLFVSLDGGAVRGGEFEDEGLVRRWFKPCQDVEDGDLFAMSRAITLCRSVMKHNVVPPEQGSRKRHTENLRSSRVQPVGPDDLGNSVRVQTHRHRAIVQVQWAIPWRHFEATRLPGPPRVGPLAQRGGGDGQIPPGGLLVGGQLCRFLVEFVGLLPSALILVQKAEIVPGN